MGAYEYISGISVLIYVFILLIISNSKQTKIRDIFLGIIVFSVLWAGGSLLMRTQALPSYVFWYHISLTGILYLPIMYFRFIMEYINRVNIKYIVFYSVILTLILLVNAATGLFIAPPAIELINGVETMVYDSLNWPVYVLFGFVGLIVIHMLLAFYLGVRKNPKLRKLTRPISFAIIVTFLGNTLILIPPFNSFPIDLLSGTINAFALLYALTKANPFRLKMLFSESVGYGICLFLSFLTLFILNSSIETMLSNFTTSNSNWTIWYLVIFSILLVLYFVIWKMVIVGIFVKDEDEKSEILNQFSASITRSLDSEYIFRETIRVIEKVIGVHNVHVALKENNKSFKLTYSNQALADLSVTFRVDNPLINRLTDLNSVVRLAEFKFDPGYQTMWEQEKYDLVKMDITHAFGLIQDDNIHGMLLISDVHSKKSLTNHQLLQLQSICTMVSIAMKNSSSYEKALIESRTDDLTKLYNRKYFYQLMEDEFVFRNFESLSLVLINLDDFKLYNQLFGVSKADKALEVIALILKGTVGQDGYVSRFSGKEFTIILPDYDVYRSIQLVEKIQKQILATSQASEKLLSRHITLSTGICVYPFGASGANELIENVQQAVYKVKRNGKNATKVFETYVQQDDESSARSITSIYDEYKSTIYALTAAIDAKDHYTFSHSDNVANYAVAFAKELQLNNDIVENVRQAGLLHDVGKISIPEHILNKPGRLNDEEFKIMQGHVDASIDIVRHLPSLEYVIPAVLGHHERYDGTGYPRRTKGEDIPLTARILCIVDAFDAIVSGRVYSKPRPIEKAIEIIREEAGKQFDPRLSEVFIEMVNEGRLNPDKTTLATTANLENHNERNSQRTKYV